MLDQLINESFGLFEEVAAEMLGATMVDPELLSESISFLTDDFVLDGMLMGLL